MAERNGNPATALDPNAPFIVPPDRIGLDEIGVAGLKIWQGMVSEEFLPELRGQRGRQIYQEMRDNDPVVGAIMLVVEMAYRRSEPTVVPARPEAEGDDQLDPTPADLAAAKHVEQCLDDMSADWSSVMSDIVEMFPYGWELMELVYKERRGPHPIGKLPDGSDPAPSKYDDGRIGWRKWAHRSQHSLDRWQMDAKGGVQGMWQRAPTSMARTFIPIQKALLFKTKDAGGNPEGRSILRNSYVPWYFRKNLQALEGISLERMGTGIPTIELPESATSMDKTNAETSIRRFRVDEQMGFVVPYGTKLTLAFGGARATGQSFESAIVRYRAEMLLAVLLQFIVLGLDKVGSYALSRTGKDVFQIALDGWLRTIEGVINRHAIPRLIDLNDFGQLSGYPKIDLGAVGEYNLELLVTALKDLVPLGLIQVNKELQQRVATAFGIPEPDENADDQLPQQPDDGMPPTTPQQKPPAAPMQPPQPQRNTESFDEDEDVCEECGEELDDDGSCPECDPVAVHVSESLADLPQPVQDRVERRASSLRRSLAGPRERNNEERV